MTTTNHYVPVFILRASETWTTLAVTCTHPYLHKNTGWGTHRKHSFLGTPPTIHQSGCTILDLQWFFRGSNHYNIKELTLFHMKRRKGGIQQSDLIVSWTKQYLIDPYRTFHHRSGSGWYRSGRKIIGGFKENTWCRGWCIPHQEYLCVSHHLLQGVHLNGGREL